MECNAPFIKLRIYFVGYTAIPYYNIMYAKQSKETQQFIKSKDLSKGYNVSLPIILHETFGQILQSSCISSLLVLIGFGFLFQKMVYYWTEIALFCIIVYRKQKEKTI